MADDKDTISVAFLSECFDADFVTGKLWWRIRPLEHFQDVRSQRIFNSQFGGKEAGTAKLKNGYHVVNFNKLRKIFLVHRMIWALANGRWPDHEVDHINGNQSDNRLINLREATHSQGGQNTKTRTDNKFGLRGVSYEKRRNMYRAYIFINGKQKHLGHFTTAEEASRVYEAAARKAFGEFYREPS